MKEANEFKQGDQVILNSGGPVMTVRNVLENELACTWWNELMGNYQMTDFPPATLRKVNPEG